MIKTSPHERLPGASRDDDRVQGHWLLARLGKRVLRPGGVELTSTMLAHARLSGADVVELAPGLGRTASEILAKSPRSYRGVENDPVASRAMRSVVAAHGEVHAADATDTGLSHSSADVVVSEAMLTMQGDKTKDAIIAEAVRLLRPGGRYAIHELGLSPDDLPDEVKTEVRQALARSIRVNARPLTLAEWKRVLARHGLVIEHVQEAPMALLHPRRVIADEGLAGALRFAKNLLIQPKARRRVLGMRHAFRTHRQHLTAFVIIAQKTS